MKKVTDFSSLRVAVLGSTGSVGTQALEVIKELGCRVVLLSARGTSDKIIDQVGEFRPEAVCLTDGYSAKRIAPRLEGLTELFVGEKAHTDLIGSVEADVIIHAVSGLAGLPSAVAASKKGVRLAIANKESIISAGDMIFDNIRKSGGELIPVDSEHSAIFQCLMGNKGGAAEVKRLILTASGGPFFDYDPEKLKSVTPVQALAHPTWRMGPKITVDCATMMNKGFEVIEATRLFGVPESAVDVVVHRQSIIHSMVEYTDNTVIAQLGYPDMRSPVRFALSYPNRCSVQTPGLDFASVASLTFEAPDNERFPLLGVAREALRMGGLYPVSLIAADEAAVEAFIDGAIGFGAIAAVVRKTLETVLPGAADSIESIGDAARRAYSNAREIISRF